MAKKKAKARPAKPKKPARTARTRSRPDWAPRFLEALSRGNIKAACLASGVGRRTVYGRRDSDPAFAQALSDALEESLDDLKAEAWRRAVDGLERKKFHKGDPLIDPETGEQYVEREYSDSLIQLLLKAHCPEFRDRQQVEHTGAVAVLTLEQALEADRELDQWERDRRANAAPPRGKKV